MAPPSAIDLNGVGADIAAKVDQEPLTFEGVPARRAKSAAISGDLATYASSDMFKGPAV